MPQNPSEPIQDRYLFELVFSGKLRSEFVPQSFLGQIVYVGVRTVLTRFSQLLEPGVGVIFLYSNLGNGKSIAMVLAQYVAFQKGFNVYSLADRGETLNEELHYAVAKDGHTVVFVDNYPEWLDVLNVFRGRIGKDLTLVMSARAASHDALAKRVSDVISWQDGLEFGLDTLDDAELEWVSGYLDHFGFWQEMAGSSSHEKMRFLKEKCGGQWSSVLLKVFEAPQILERLNALLGEFDRTSEFRDSLLKLLLLSVLGYHPNAPSVITLCGDAVLSRRFKTNGTVSELIDFSGNSFTMRSSVISTVILKRISDPNRVIRALVELVTQVDLLADSSDYHWELFKNLVRFSSINAIFTDESRGRAAMRVYEEIKGLSHCSRYPLFWLQYAIAALVTKDFQRSKAYFDTAYSLADRLDQYDAFQIDNHYARFLLERAIDTDCSPSDRMAPFREARSLLRPQFNEEWRHYPYRVAANYFDFISRFSAQLGAAEKQEIRGAAEEILERIARLPEERKHHRSITDCRTAQLKILRIT